MDDAENELLTRVGPGTAAGETRRKYWLPVGLSGEISSDAPKLVRWLGEDLLLFRDEFGRVGLIEPMGAKRSKFHCLHFACLALCRKRLCRFLPAKPLSKQSQRG